MNIKELTDLEQMTDKEHIVERAVGYELVS